MNAPRRSGLSPIVLSLGLGAALVWAVPGQAVAQDVFPPDLPNECTLANVAGVFGFNEDTPMGREDRPRPVSLIGILDLRPNGDAAIQVKGFFEPEGDLSDGVIVEGEWSVEPNCFGFIDLQEFPSGEELDLAFVAVENGTELFLIRNNPLEEADAKLLFRR